MIHFKSIYLDTFFSTCTIKPGTIKLYALLLTCKVENLPSLLKFDVFVVVRFRMISTTLLSRTLVPNPGKCFCTSSPATSKTLEFKKGSDSFWNQCTVSNIVFPLYSNIIGKLRKHKSTAINDLTSQKV